MSRKAIKDHPGCDEFAKEVIDVLNTKLRPFTAKWHRPREQGWLNSRDGGDAFRCDLAAVQRDLLALAGSLHQMAYETPLEVQQAPGPMAAELDGLFQPLPFGIPISASANGGISSADSGSLRISEAKAVTVRRGNVENLATHDATGLAFSGGGIRSATFCLGVLQVLAEKELTKEVDFLSTVSGGGYTGSFVTREVGENGDWTQVACPDGPDTQPIRRLRQRAKFLTARSLWDAWGMVTATVAGTLLNWSVPLLILAAAAALTASVPIITLDQIPWSALCGIGLLVCSGAAVLYFLLLRKGARAALLSGRFFGVTAMLPILTAGAWGVHLAFHWIFKDAREWPDLPAMLDQFWGSPLFSWIGLGAISIGSISTLLPTITRFIPFLEKPAVRKVVLKVAMGLAGTFLPLVGVVVYILLLAVGSVKTMPWGMTGTASLWWLTVALVVLTVFVLNINLNAPHRIYRNALSRTFVERKAEGDPDLPLSQSNVQNKAPYHLINAAVNLPSTQSPGIRERTCDFFLFSRDWVGSPLIGYQASDKWKMNGKPADLATAMAISGAAFSSHMGLGSIRPLRALLTFLNVRLGFWIRKPNAKGLWGFPAWKHPGFLCLLREMSGVGMAENHRWFNLSDGGHIENLATYELLRRRCKFIICVDGEADPGFTFQGLMTLVRHAQIDLGIRIEPSLDDLRPDPKSGFSRSHYHLCRIHYPDAGEGSPAGTGLLLYLKLSVTGNESELIRRYRTNHPEFPHESTLDQFFDEEQFEAYRQLGVHAARGLFSPCLMNGKSAPTTINDWFRRLAENLLLPKL